MATSVVRGAGTPEGFIEASRGTFYINTQSLSIYVKVKGDGNNPNGWSVVNAKGYYEGIGDPEGIIPAPKFAFYFDTQGYDLYMQTSDNTPILATGWVSVNKSNIKTSTGNPNTEGVDGVDGDIYIDESSFSVYVKKGNDWERIPLMSVDSSDILLKLSELLTNSTSIVSQYFNMFFNPNPMDVELAQYDQDGNLQVYTIPNRAKDKESIEAFVPATDLPLGYKSDSNTLYVDMDEEPRNGSTALLSSGTLYTEFEKIGNQIEECKHGSADIVFSAAEPLSDENVATKKYVDNIFANLFSYDNNTHTLLVNAPLNDNISTQAMVVGQTGTLTTPAYGTPYSTEFVFDEPWKEPEGHVTSIRSDLPCKIIVTSEPYEVSGATIPAFDNVVEITSDTKTIRPFTDTMAGGIRKMKVVSCDELDNPTIDTVRNIYTSFTASSIDIPQEDLEKYLDVQEALSKMQDKVDADIQKVSDAKQDKVDYVFLSNMPGVYSSNPPPRRPSG